MSWQRIDNKHNLRNKGGDMGESRIYGLDGKLWPRIVVRISSTDLYGDEGFQVSSSRKDKGGAWWANCAIPPELRDDVIEMLRNKTTEGGQT